MKFDDPKTKALLTSVSGSAAVFRAVFIAYLIFAGYAGTIILSVTDRILANNERKQHGISRLHQHLCGVFCI